MTHKTLGDRILAIITGTLGSLVPSGVTSSINRAVDFAYVRVLGLPFIVLGYRQSGKTTLLEWLRRNTAYLGDFDPEPTAAGGTPIGPFGANLGDEVLRVKPRRDVGGEYAMWETDWVTLFREARPRGIIFVMDHTNPYQHKDALNFVLQMIDEDPATSKHLRMILILVNKADLWADGTTLEALMSDYRNEVRRLKSQAQRLGYGYLITPVSVLNGTGVEDAMRRFFNVLRPRPRKDIPAP
ncbi:MAG: hypothetical protein Kow0077_00780 [Anaerolineae bacterium]